VTLRTQPRKLVINYVKLNCFSRFGVCAIGTGCVLLLPQANAGLAGITAQGVDIAEFGPTDSSLVAKIHADRFFTDYEHHGFFRIGLLPVAVVENVKIQIYSVEGLTNALFAMRQWHRSSAGVRRLELRNLKVVIAGETRPRLLASRARIGNDSTLDLFDVSLTSPEGQVVSLPKAALQIAGRSAGRLSWNAAGRKEDLFPLNPKTQTQ
jgi:hypothetical protein